MPVVRKVSAKAGRYLVVPDIHPVFQIRVPKDLVACRNVPPLRVSLGPVSRREARRLADELAVMARRLFDEGRRTMESATDSNVGSPDWLAGIRDNLVAGLVRLQNPPPAPAPLEAAAHHAIGHLVEIEKELKKGAAASPLIAANADRLRKHYHDRLIVLGRLDDALKQRTNDDTLYARLAALDTPAAASAATPVPPATMPMPAAFGAAAPAPAASAAIAPAPPAPIAEPAPVLPLSRQTRRPRCQAFRSLVRYRRNTSTCASAPTGRTTRRSRLCGCGGSFSGIDRRFSGRSIQRQTSAGLRQPAAILARPCR